MKMATATMTKNEFEKNVFADCVEYNKNKKKKEESETIVIKTATDLEKVLELVNNKPYKILFDEKGLPKKRKSGKITLRGRIESYTDNNGTNSYHKKRLVFLLPLSKELLDFILGNFSNPRDALYKSARRKEIPMNLYDSMYYPYFANMNQGLSLSVANIDYETLESGMSNITFEIPHKEGEDSDIEIANYNKRYGLYDGQNLYYIALTFIKAVIDGIITIEGNLEDRYVRVVLDEYDEKMPLPILMRIIQAKNNCESQSDRVIERHSGVFNDLISNNPEIANKYVSGIELKQNSKYYDSKIKEIKESDDMLSEAEMVACYPVKPEPEQIAKEYDLVYTSANARDEYIKCGLDNARNKDTKRGNFKEVQKRARNKYNACNAWTKYKEDQTKETGVPELRYNACRKGNIPEQYLTFRDTFLSYDFAKINTEVREELGIKRNNENVITPFTNAVMVYDIPVYVANIIPEIFGYLCELDTVNQELQYSRLKYETFLDNYIEKILTKMAKTKKKLHSKGVDTYGFATPSNDDSADFHIALMKICYDADVKSKAKDKFMETPKQVHMSKKSKN